MTGLRRRHSEDAIEAANRQTASLAGLAVTLLLLVMSVFLIRQLSHATKVEDCLLAGRSNCDIVAIRAR